MNLFRLSILVGAPDLTDAVFSGLRSAGAAAWPMLLLVAAATVLVAALKSPIFKGWVGEAATARMGLGKLDPRVYRVFNDLYLPRPDGKGTTQIDHVVMSEFGIFVIETKNFSGWIFGGELDEKWTQQFPRKRVSFQNPIRQNWLHVQALRAFLEVPESVFIPLVWFAGDATFKTPLPPGVLTRGLIPHITEYVAVLLDEEILDRAKARLGALDQSLDRRKASREHIARLLDRQR